MNAPFRRLLPEGVAIAQACSATPELWQEGLLPSEQPFIESAVPKRKEEFTAGRNCVRQALAELNYPNYATIAIKVGSHREPRFPTDIIGTITHTQCKLSADKCPDNDIIERYCAAALVKRSGCTIKSLGIDSEANTPLDNNLVELICSESEQRHFKRLDNLFEARQPHNNIQSVSTHRNNRCNSWSNNWSKVAFSAKESFYKAYFPLARCFLDFLEVEIEIHPDLNTQNRDSGSFSIQLLSQKALQKRERSETEDITGKGIKKNKIVKEKTETKETKETKDRATQSEKFEWLHKKEHVGRYCWDNRFIYTAITIEQ